MCLSVYVIDEKRHIGTVREFAGWLGIEPEALILDEIERVGPEAFPNDEWKDSCLCGFDIAANLDRAEIWHRTDIKGDSMMTLATKATPSR